MRQADTQRKRTSGGTKRTSGGEDGARKRLCSRRLDQAFFFFRENSSQQQATFHLTERQKDEAQTINVHHEGTKEVQTAKNGVQAKTDKGAQVEPKVESTQRNETRQTGTKRRESQK